MNPASAGLGVKFVVAGSGGMGRESLDWAVASWPAAEPMGFWVAPGEGSGATGPSGLPTIDDLDLVCEIGATHVVLGIGDNTRRAEVAQQAEAAGLQSLTVVHPTAFLGAGTSVGPGAIIGPGVLLTRDVVVAEGSIVNYGASVGHDGSIGAFVFIGPAAALAGDVLVGDRAAIGVGAVVLPGTRIGAEATVGGGAVVVRGVMDGSTVVGNPARILR